MTRSPRKRTPPVDGTHNTAFLSYSRKDDDVAKVVHEALEAAFRPLHRLRTLRVFRDKTGLPYGPALWPTLRREIERSEWLILLASPHSAASSGVRFELDAWRERGAADNLIVIHLSGALRRDPETGYVDVARSDALPDRVGPEGDERAHDSSCVHWNRATYFDLVGLGRDGAVAPTRRDPRLRAVIEQVVATIHGTPAGVLRRRYLVQQWLAATVLAALLVGPSWWFVKQQRLHEQQRLQAEKERAAELEAKERVAVEAAAVAGEATTLEAESKRMAEAAKVEAEAKVDIAQKVEGSTRDFARERALVTLASLERSATTVANRESALVDAARALREAGAGTLPAALHLLPDVVHGVRRLHARGLSGRVWFLAGSRMLFTENGDAFDVAGGHFLAREIPRESELERAMFGGPKFPQIDMTTTWEVGEHLPAPALVYGTLGRSSYGRRTGRKLTSPKVGFVALVDPSTGATRTKIVDLGDAVAFAARVSSTEILVNWHAAGSPAEAGWATAVMRIPDGRVIRRFPTDRAGQGAACVSTDGSIAFVAGQLFEVSTGRALCEPVDPKFGRPCFLTPEGYLFGLDDDRLVCFDPRAGWAVWEHAFPFDTFGSGPSGMSMSADGDMIAVLVKSTEQELQPERSFDGFPTGNMVLDEAYDVIHLFDLAAARRRLDALESGKAANGSRMDLDPTSPDDSEARAALIACTSLDVPPDPTPAAIKESIRVTGERVHAMSKALTARFELGEWDAAVALGRLTLDGDELSRSVAASWFERARPHARSPEEAHYLDAAILALRVGTPPGRR